MSILYPLDMKYVSKPWGWELWICNNDRYCGKKLFIKQGHWLSYHHHNVKDEVLFVESGKIWFTHDEFKGQVNSIQLTVGQAFHVRPDVKHQMQAIEDTILFEFSTTHRDEDSIRETRDLVVDHGDNGNRVRTWQVLPKA
jgi:mannose-6-phosphate isomerase-like protein (cupin superfamily)